MLKISAKTDYACKALLELSINWPNTQPVSISTIAQSQRIPLKFLTQILLNLKQVGYVESVRGKQGGYLLIVPPKEINLGQVLLAFEAKKNVKNQRGMVSKKDVMAHVWHEIDSDIMQKLIALTFENICNRKKQLDNVVSYEI